MNLRNWPRPGDPPGDRLGDPIRDAMGHRLGDLIAFTVALVSIGLYCVLTSYHRILWWDEVFGWKLVTDPSWGHMLSAWRSGVDGGGLGFYLLCRLWLAVFGHTLLSFRAISACACMVAFFVLWRVLTRFYAPWIVLGSLILVWFSSDTILFQMIETRFYGLLLAAATIALLAALRSREDHIRGKPHRLSTLVFVLLANTLLIETHPFGVLYSAVLLCGSGIDDALARRPRPAYYLASVLPWPLLLFSRQAMLNSARVGKPWFWTTTPAWSDLLAQYTPNIFQRSAVCGLAFFLVLAAVPVTRRRLLADLRNFAAVLWPALLLLFVPVIFFLGSQRGTSIFVDRYMIPVMIGVAIVLAEALHQVRLLIRGLPSAKALLLIALLGACSYALRFAWVHYRSFIVVPPFDFITPLEAQLPPGLPVVVERTDIFITLLQQNPQPAHPFRFLLDWPFAIAPDTPRGFVSGYNEIVNLERAGYAPGMVQDAQTFLREHDRFLLLHGGGLNWLDTRILNNPQWTATKLGDSGSGFFAMSIWLIQRR